MAKKMYLAGVGEAKYFTQDGDLVFTAKTLMDSSISIGAENAEIRGGEGNALIGRYWHTSSFGLTLQDALFDLNYLSLKVGNDLVVGTEVMTKETVTVGEAGAITVQGTPVEFLGGKYGYYGDNQRCVFTGKTATVTGFKQGDKIMVEYYANNEAATELMVESSFIPAEGYMQLTGKLFLGEAGASSNASSYVGEIIVEIPRFQLNASTELSMSASGASQTSLDGQALVAFDAKTQKSYFSKIKQVLIDGKFYDGMVGLAFESVDDIQKGDTLIVYGVYKNAKPKVITPDKLTFSGADTSGVVTATSGTKVTAKLKSATGVYAKLIAEATVQA